MNLNNQSINVKLQGNPKNPPIILGHALGMNLNAWDYVSGILSNNYYVLMWDLPGHGKSAPLSKDKSQLGELEIVDELLKICDELKIDKFHYVGTSIGGVIGQQLSIFYPERLLSLSLTNTGAKIGTPEAWMERKKNVEVSSLKTMNVDIVSRWFSKKSLSDHPYLLETWNDTLAKTDDHSYALLCEWLSEHDLRGKLKPLNIPAIFIAGSEDIATPPQVVLDLAKYMEINDICCFENVGHIPSVEIPDIFTNTLVTFLINS